MPPVLSDGGFPPAVWGPSFWKSMHYMAAAFPVAPTDAEREAYFAWFASLRHVLPCPGCRVGYGAITSQGPLKLTRRVVRDRMTLFAWTVGVHNAVNLKLGKPIVDDPLFWYRRYDRNRAG